MNLRDVVIKNEEGKIYKAFVGGRVNYFTIKDGLLQVRNRPKGEFQRSNLAFNMLAEFEVNRFIELENPFERVGDGEEYYYLDDELIVRYDGDHYSALDNDRYIIGNYFNNEEVAKEARKFIEKAFEEFKISKLKELKL